jgi:hypothetical protein
VRAGPLAEQNTARVVVRATTTAFRTVLVLAAGADSSVDSSVKILAPLETDEHLGGKMDKQLGPRRREQGLTVETLGDELLVFDQDSNRAHSLNATAASVWQACDGTRTPDQLAEWCELDPQTVSLALDTLADTNLLAGYDNSGERVSRRTVIRRMALTGAGVGVALPVVRSIVAPSAAMAVSGARCNPTGCATSSYCSYSGTCHHGHSASHGSGHPCTGNNECAYNFICTTSHQCQGL